MNKQNITLVIIVVILAGVVGYFLLASKPATAPIEPASVPPSPDAVSPTIPPTTLNENWNIFRNIKYAFSLSYPDYLAAVSQTENSFKANSDTEEIRIDVSDKSLDGREFLASDGVVGSSVFRYSSAKDEWLYIGMAGRIDSENEKYPIIDVRKEDESTLRSEGYVPVKYRTKNGLTTWVGKSTNIHSTQGGENWQIAFVEDPQKQFVVKIFTKQCVGYYNSCNDPVGPERKPTSNSQTIFSIVDTLRFSDFVE